MRGLLVMLAGLLGCASPNPGVAPIARPRVAADSSRGAPAESCSTARLFLRERFDSSDIPICDESRVFTVQERDRGEALAVLGDEEFTALSPELVRRLLPETRIDTKHMLGAQASAADAYAQKREAEAANPSFASSRDWMLATAKAHRDFARYTRGLSPELRAYLIKGRGYSEGTGSFIVRLQGTTLSVVHGSLGSGPIEEHVIPVVVFLERAIERVALGSSSAE